MCTLTHNESLCVRELLEEFPKVLIALLVCRAQHLQWQAESETTHTQTHTRILMLSSQVLPLSHSLGYLFPRACEIILLKPPTGLIGMSALLQSCRDFHPVGDFHSYCKWKYRVRQAEVCSPRYLKGRIITDLKRNTRKESAQCKSFKTHAAMTGIYESGYPICITGRHISDSEAFVGSSMKPQV